MRTEGIAEQLRLHPAVKAELTSIADNAVSGTAAACDGSSTCQLRSASPAKAEHRDFYLKKRGEGLKHVQAVIALARRRADVMWALLCDNRLFTPAPPVTQPA